jgi:Sulfatase
LAKQGTIFNHAYSSCPSCIAARASLFIGLAPNSHGRIGYQDKVEWNYENMLPQVLGDAGYQTHYKIDGLIPLSSSTEKRPYIHSEHHWHIDQSWQILTDGLEKYIWWAESGKEQFFDLQNDPDGMNDLGQNYTFSERLKYWRECLIAKLAERPEDGLSDGNKLTPGKALSALKTCLVEK